MNRKINALLIVVYEVKSLPIEECLMSHILEATINRSEMIKENQPTWRKSCPVFDVIM